MANLNELIRGGIFDIDLGVSNPSISGVFAGKGARGFATDGTQWVKIGVGDTEWVQVVIASDNGKIPKSIYDVDADDVTNLSLVATSNDYNDLDNKPDLSLYDNFDPYTTQGEFPVVGEIDVIYLEENTGKLFRWTGLSYAEISSQLVIGEISTTAYRGDRGKIAYDHSQLITGNPHSVTKTQVGLSNVDNTSDVNKPVSAATQTALNLKADDADLTSHITDITNPHSVTKTQVGLSNVDNTSDVNKPVSAATQTALNLKANKTDLVLGSGSVATGIYASAVGYDNEASGSYSSAVGYRNTASGYYGRSSAFGYDNEASGSYSSAVGHRNTTGSSYSSAVGYNNTASSEFSSAFGYYNKAWGNSSSAVGYYNEASFGSSSTFGYRNTASGTNSTAVGYNNTASGTDSTAFGHRAKAQALNSVAIGRSVDTHTTGLASVNVGILNNTTGGTLNTTTGAITGAITANTSQGRLTTSVGINNTTNGDRSIAVGYNNTASGTDSTAFGYRAKTTIDRTVEIGYWQFSTRTSAIRMHPDKQVAITIKDSATVPTDGGATDGSEADGTLPREMYSLRRSGDDLYIDININGTVKTLSLGTAI